LIALIGPAVGVALTLFVTGRREARSRFGDEKRSIYADFLIACARLRNTEVWSSTEPGGDIASALAQVRVAAMHAVLTAHRDVGRELAGVIAAAERLAATIEEIRRASKPGYGGAVDERHRARYERAVTTLSSALNQFTKAARLDLNVRTPMSEPFPVTDSDT